MTLHVPRLPFSLDPLIAEAKRRMRRRRLLVVTVALAALTLAGSVVATRSPGGPGSAGPPGNLGLLSAPGRAGSVRIDPEGAIGPLQMNRSTLAQVVAYAGEPSVLRAARGDGQTRYRVLGYACRPGAGTEKYWSSYPIACRTAFYLVGGRLSLFITQDPRFAEAAGVGIGTPTKRAEQLLHQRAFSGCVSGIRLQGKRAWTTVALGGGGGRVVGFYLHGLRSPGVTDCD
ncbi:MAG TPA: hypothetical protein VJ814_06880 [Gaiellaceae bacterium]|nr:hypothetical protein [Gaiellaceae bacterium]